RAAGHDVLWSGDWDRDPGDTEILARAAADERSVVTLDKDFGELAVVRGQRHCGIVRLVGISIARQAHAIEDVISRYGAELSKGALVTVEPSRVRVRPAD
ncbi:MAG: DUF5615 family PIN-like protein, partial [Planctomycetes bacterium]|nr:DUF5615 family PIN-like protein [Planctomycetota bacterium]